MDSLDVRPLAPAVHHSTILEHLDALEAGALGETLAERSFAHQADQRDGGDFRVTSTRG